MSMPTYVPIQSREDIDALVAASNDAPAVLFLHDWTCPISDRAQGEVDRLDGTIHTVDVTTQHDLNRYIAEKTGVRHESPQLFIFAGGKPAFDASHGRIRVDAIAALLEELSTRAPGSEAAS